MFNNKVVCWNCGGTYQAHNRMIRTGVYPDHTFRDNVKSAREIKSANRK